MTTTARTTRKQNVYETLKAARSGSVEVAGTMRTTTGGWIPGYLLTGPTVGGTDGLRRLRELRADGYEIAMRVADGIYQYRLVRVNPVV